MENRRLWCRKLALLAVFSALVFDGVEAFSHQEKRPQSCGEPLMAKPLTVLELELRFRSAKGRLFLAADEIVNLLTTSNGQVNGLLSESEIKNLPRSLRMALHTRHPGELAFDTLPSMLRYELILFALKQRRQPGSAMAIDLGLQVRNRLTVGWIDDRVFLGKLYSLGRRGVVDISSLLTQQSVELVGEELNSVKIRFSSRSHSPQELAKEIMTLLEGRQIGRSNALLRVAR